MVVSIETKISSQRGVYSVQGTCGKPVPDPRAHLIL